MIVVARMVWQLPPVVLFSVAGDITSIAAAPGMLWHENMAWLCEHQWVQSLTVGCGHWCVHLVVRWVEGGWGLVSAASVAVAVSIVSSATTASRAVVCWMGV